MREQNRPGEAGELAVVFDRKDRFLAIGLYDPDSPICLRVLHAGKPVTLDERWWQQRFEAALQRRSGLFDANTNGYRCIHGESDGWPGLVLDRYDSVYVLKLYTPAWFPHLPLVTRLINDIARPSHLVLRLSRNVQGAAPTPLRDSAGATPPPGTTNPPGSGSNDGPLRDGQVIVGPPLKATSTFLETGLCFEADVLRGQKTGFFLDQRENRRRVEALAGGRSVLNAFSFSGGFSMYAARGGAASVTDLDISAHALAAAGRNFALNQSNPAVARCVHETVQADTFEWLDQNHARRFDLVILDPPSLAKREAERHGAIQAYARLALSGSELLRPGGVLVAASCSAHVSAGEFFDAVRHGTRKSGRKWTEIETTGHPPDHPAAFPEAHYLKCIYLTVERSTSARTPAPSATC